MKILYNQGDRPSRTDINEGDLVYNTVDGIMYSKDKLGNIIIVSANDRSDTTETGSYHKSADGTLICYGSVVVTNSVEVLWKFPHPFGVPPAVFPSKHGAGVKKPFAPVAGAVTTDTCLVNIWRDTEGTVPADEGEQITVTVFAIGTWKVPPPLITILTDADGEVLTDSEENILVV